MIDINHPNKRVIEIKEKQMAFKELGDVTPVVLGGVNKETGIKNPTQLEGYFIRKEERPNKFNPGKPQSFYVFQTKDGDRGLFGKAGIDREMKKASIGAMTKVVDTGTVLDTGKGNPMKVFKVYQDNENTIDVSLVEDYTQAVDEPETDLDNEDLLDEAPPARVAAPKKTPVSPDAARVQALLAKARTR